VTSTFGVSAATPSGLGGQDSTQLLQRIFTGRVVGAPGIAYGGVSATVVSSTDTTCIVTVPLTNSQTLTYTCLYQPSPGNGNPPAGTACFIAFAANGDHSPWVTAFSGWPS
jgi:hypothetical protein